MIEFAGLIAAQEDKPTIHVSDNWFERFKRDIRKFIQSIKISIESDYEIN